MSLSCGCDGEDYVSCEPDGPYADTAIAANTIICRECGHLIKPGEEYYRARLWGFGYWDPESCTPWVDEGDEIQKGVHEVCDGCGGVAHTILQLGYCWNFGSLRSDVRELAALQQEAVASHLAWKRKREHRQRVPDHSADLHRPNDV